MVSSFLPRSLAHVCPESPSPDLNPLLGVDAGGLKRSRTLQYPVRGAEGSAGDSVGQGQGILLSGFCSHTPMSKEVKKAVNNPSNGHLTRWRDAVGKEMEMGEEMGEGVTVEEDDEEQEQARGIQVVEFLGSCSGFSVV
ncbi:hypothetical protein C8J56DRAFT_888826 [Mycena floridula]|nr:hypothetical protein C8J56DRAFT_888826 [Mycena floridula]